MKLVTIIYHSEYADDIRGLLDVHGIREFVEAPRLWGMDADGKHFDTHVWPGTDSLMYLPLPAEKAAELLEAVRAWKECEKERRHVRLLISPVEEFL